jgi:hypothetical protein
VIEFHNLERQNNILATLLCTQIYTPQKEQILKLLSPNQTDSRADHTPCCVRRNETAQGTKARSNQSAAAEARHTNARERKKKQPSRRPRGRQRRDLGERRGHGAGQRRRAADRARGALPEPGVDAGAVEQVAAVGEHPDHVAVAVALEADGAAARLVRRRLPRLRVGHRRERLERGLVDAPPGVAALPRRRGRGGGLGHGGARAEVDGERDGGGHEEDADGHADAVAEPADAARPE